VGSVTEDVKIRLEDATAPPPQVGFQRRSVPVKLWAAVGAAFLIFEVYLFTAWVVSGDAKPAPLGPDHPSSGYRMFVHIWEISNVVIALAVLYHFIVKPWRRERTVTLEGLLSLVFLLIFWQDPLSNYVQTVVTYSAAQTNLGSWVAHIPGWNSPHGNQLGWPIVWGPSAYIYFWMASVLAGGFIMDRARRRWPRLSRLQVITLCYFTMALVDLAGELVWVRSGFYTFIGPSFPSLTLFYGHYYQFPMYETFILCLPMTAFTCLRYFRNDRGQTIVERGIDQVQGSLAKKTALRFLALLGICNIIFLGLYNVPMQWFGFHVTTPVHDVLDHSYLLDGICGPGTTYACAAPSIPIPGPGSQHLSPDGKLVGSP
jgi:hypothetical protein